MADVARLDKYANWLIQNKDKKGTPDFDKVANAYRALRSQDTPPANDNSDNSDNSDNTGINSPTGGFMEAIAQGVDAPLDAMGTTASVLGYEKTGEFLTNLTEAPEGYESASAKFIKGDPDQFLGYDYKYLPKATIEQGAQFVGQLGARAGGAALGSTLGPAGAVGGAIVAPMVLSAAQHLGPMALERANNQGRDKPNMDDFLYVSTSTAGIALLDSIGLGGKSKVLMTALKEFGTEGLQSVVEQVGTSVNTEAGLNVDPKQAFGEAILGATSSGTVSTAISTVSKTGEVIFKPRQELDPEVDQAAGDVARMIKEISEDSKYNLKDIDPTSQKGANETLGAVRSKIKAEVVAAAGEINRQIIKDLDPLTVQRFKQIVSTSNLKVGGSVTPADIQFIKDLAGTTQYGQQMVNGLYKSNVLTELNAAGLKGGFSNFTDVFNPLNNMGKGYNPARDIGGMLNLGAVAGTGGASLATQIPLVIGGRAIDAVTGRRSKVNRFVKKNAKKSGLATAVGTQLPQNQADIERENKAQVKANQVQYNAEQDNKKFDQARSRMRYNAELQNKKFDKSKSEDAVRKAEAKAKLDRENAKQVADAKEKALTARLNVLVNSERGAYTSDSPQGFIMQQTGLDYDGVELALSRLQDRYPNNPDVTEMISRYNQMFDSGYKETGKTLTPLKNMLVNTIENDPQLKKLKKKLAKSKKKKAEIDPRVQKGIDENRKILSELKASMEADMSISNRDKAVLDKAFKELSKTLGTNPVTMAKMIIKDAKADMDQPAKTNKYLEPYLDRVKIQQIKPKVNIQPQ